MDHPVQALFAALPAVEPFPEGVVRMTGRISGTAFFPGGAGLWDTDATRPLPPMPTNGVMILGHDFHSQAAFEKSIRKGGEVQIDSVGAASSTVPSWTNLFRMLRDFGIPTRRCFFTNVYMGLRAADKTTGRFPGARDAAFVDRCRMFFSRQLEAQRPRLILALGAWVPPFLAPLSDQLADWASLRSLHAIDQGKPVRHAVTFRGAAAPQCSVVCLTHPSLHGPNVGRRAYASLNGVHAEQAMVADGIRVSGVDLRVV
jgi:hypothetical protein